MSELTCLLLSVLLWVVHVLGQAGCAQSALSLPYLFSPRDKPLAPQGVTYGRATHALANYVENFAAFAALDLFGVVYARSTAWAIGLLAIVMMLVRLTWL